MKYVCVCVCVSECVSVSVCVCVCVCVCVLPWLPMTFQSEERVSKVQFILMHRNVSEHQNVLK